MNSVEDLPIWKGGIDRFNAKEPNITIVHEQAPWGTYWEKLAASTAAGDLADAILMVSMYTQQYGRLGAIQDLSSYAKVSGNLEDQWPPVKLANSINGKWPLQMMYDLSTLCVYYNRDMFKAAGVPDPIAKLPDYWTFDDFREAAIKLTQTVKGQKQWGMGSRPDLWTNGDAMMQSGGGGLINKENTKCLLDQPESIQVVEQLAELFTKYNVAPSAQEAQDISLFESGRVAMEIGNPELALRYRERIKDFEWDVAPLPVSAKTKAKVNWVHGGGLSMGSKTKQAEATWKFIEYYTSADNLKIMIGGPARGIPGRPSVKDSVLRPDKPPKHMELFLDAVPLGVCTVVSSFDELQKIIGPAVQIMFDGKRPVAEVMKEITPQVQALVDQLKA